MKVTTKKLTKTKFVQLMSQVTGHSKSFVEKNMRTEGVRGDMFHLAAGEFQYRSWVRDHDYIYTTVSLNNSVCSSFYHNFDTLINDSEKDDKEREKERQNLLDSMNE